MTLPLKKLTKSPAERKRYLIDYSEWLDTGEILTGINFTTLPNDPVYGFAVDAYAIANDGLSVAIFISGGQDGVAYEIDIVANTSTGQIKEDVILCSVKDAV